MKCLGLILLKCLTLIHLGGRCGTLILQIQKTIEWSLKESGKTPDCTILPGWETKIQSSKEEELGVTLVGSVMS